MSLTDKGFELDRLQREQMVNGLLIHPGCSDELLERNCELIREIARLEGEIERERDGPEIGGWYNEVERVS